MSTKVINIVVPADWDVPEELNIFCPEEKSFILDIGCKVVKDARSLVTDLSQKEIYNKIHEERKSEIKKLEKDLLVQQEVNSKLDTYIRSLYEKKLEEMNKEIEELNKQIINFECQNKNVIESKRL